MEEAAHFFKALGDPTRLRILKLLEHGELCVCHLTAVLGMGQSRISHHLSILKKAGLIADRREGKWAYYRLSGGVQGRLRDRYGALEKEETVKKDRETVIQNRPQALCAMPPRKKTK